jgi:lysophospholipid acyltransferase (LPLAT)-like uncharacterized protein
LANASQTLDNPVMLEPSPDLASAVAEQEAAGVKTGARLAEGPGTFTLWKRVQIFFATWIGHLALLLIGRSLRWEVIGQENYEAARQLRKSFIVTVWHREIFSGVWFWRKRGMVVMVSQNFDGEYIARILRKHGYAVARGSSSRSASRVLVEMIRAIRKGREAAVTPDGPRGPRFVAKPGVVLLAKATGAAILCFHILPQRAWVLRKSWDRTEIPRPFARTAIFIAPPITVDPEVDQEELARKLQKVQATLDGLQKQGEAWKLETGN